MPDLSADLRRMFEIGRHAIALQTVAVEPHDGWTLERLELRTAKGEFGRALLTRPSDGVPVGGNAARRPAILYIHAHGDRYDIGAAELVDGRPALPDPLGPVLARRGYVTLSIDLPCFGSRAGTAESAATKAALWRGGSLAGQMLGELASAVSYLAARPDVDAGRIGAFGLSMGATFGYWLAAVDPRIACVAHLCCYADFASLIETGAHDLHGIYLTVPGLIARASNGEIAGLVAPRPQLVCIGDEDPLTPPTAVDRALAETRAAYVAMGAEDLLQLHREPATGHRQSPEMRAAVLAFFDRCLG